MKNAVFWDVTPRECFKNRRFGGTYHSVLRLLVTGNISSSPIFVTLMMEAIILMKRRFLQEPHGVISPKTLFFTVLVCNMFICTRGRTH
jgi:hypothetical protein